MTGAEQLLSMQESDLLFALEYSDTSIVINGHELPCVASSYDETRFQDHDGIGEKLERSRTALIVRSAYNGKPIEAGRDLALVRRMGTEIKHRIEGYSESASGHAIFLTLRAVR